VILVKVALAKLVVIAPAPVEAVINSGKIQEKSDHPDAEQKQRDTKQKAEYDS
jgi:hypothetical protein